jgi:hypothetical protein
MKIDIHHKFSQTRANRMKYGSLIDHPANIVRVSHADHMSKSMPKFNEREFAMAVGILDCDYCERGDFCTRVMVADECRRWRFDGSKYNKSIN